LQSSGAMRSRGDSVNPNLIGYFPTRTLKRPDWLNAPCVEEICSVSTSISNAPEGWIDQWRHNEMWVYDTPELVWSVVPQGVRKEFALYAYEIFPIIFDGDQQQPFHIPFLEVTPLPPSFERLGFDVVSRSCGTSFECSPLSCNHMAEHVLVTRHCLLSDAETAFQLAAEFARGGCEPGPCHVVLVWRVKRSSIADGGDCRNPRS
jgi:hypothetical protein